ncbi:hypothetical protein EDB19DRAFT_2026801 [Suillus lakei]|nr:hypothetical protein EDB19DRAFT_2026801 [Suillus lakei]
MASLLNRIEEVNLKGPVLHAVTETNFKSLSQATALDDGRNDTGSIKPTMLVSRLDALGVEIVDPEKFPDTIALQSSKADIPPEKLKIRRLVKSEATQVHNTYFAAIAEDFNEKPIVMFFLHDSRNLTFCQILPPTFCHLPNRLPPDLQKAGVEVPPATPSPFHTQVPILPFETALMGTAHSEFRLISYVYAFGQATRVWLRRSAYDDTTPRT